MKFEIYANADLYEKLKQYMAREGLKTMSAAFRKIVEDLDMRTFGADGYDANGVDREGYDRLGYEYSEMPAFHQDSAQFPTIHQRFENFMLKGDAAGARKAATLADQLVKDGATEEMWLRQEAITAKVMAEQAEEGF